MHGSTKTAVKTAFLYDEEKGLDDSERTKGFRK